MPEFAHRTVQNKEVGMKILIIDSSSASQNRLRPIILELFPGAEIITIRNTADYGSLREKSTIDIAFIEAGPEGTPGVGLAAALRTEACRCNIIFMSKYKVDAAYAMSVHPSGFLKKPFTKHDVIRELSDLRYPEEALKEDTNRLKVLTFGSFVVYKGENELLRFSRSKSKEIFAYLIDQFGYTVTSTDIARDVFERTLLDNQTSKNISKYVSCLQKDLAEAGFPDALIKQNRSLQVNKSRIDCDLFKALDGNSTALESFKGEYLQEYSWAEYSDSAHRLRSLTNRGRRQSEG